MLSPGTVLDAGTGRLRVLIGGPPTVVGRMPGGFAFGANGRLCINAAAPAGNNYIKGIRTTTDGIIYGTLTTAGTDQYLGGLRVTTAGALVYASAAGTAVNAGDPTTSTGALAVINS
jgi:hypothetical protein